VLVTEFLELAGAEAGLSHEQREPVDVAAVLRGLQAGLAADPRWQAVTWKLGGLKAPSVVPGVTVRLERAFRNLLINALSFAGDTPWVEVALRRHEETCEVTVRDSGPGISPEQLPHLFERFFTTRRERSGTGLGLALTHAIVQAHGGSITVSSPPGQGAAFVVRLPAG
jgi:signal transduction histidine kinase